MSIIKRILSIIIIIGLMGLPASIFLIILEIIDPGYKHIKGWRLYIKTDKDKCEDLKTYIGFFIEFLFIDCILLNIYLNI